MNVKFERNCCISSNVIDQKPPIDNLVKICVKKGHNSVKFLQNIPLFELCLYLIMLDPSVKLNEIDASLQELSIGNQKCDTLDADAGVMIPMCHPCFAGDTKIQL